MVARYSVRNFCNFPKYPICIPSLSDLFGMSEEKFLRITEHLMNTLIIHIKDFIYWPKRSDYRQIADEFNKIGKYVKNYFHDFP